MEIYRGFEYIYIQEFEYIFNVNYIILVLILHNDPQYDGTHD